MIASLRGNVVSCLGDTVILDVQGVGYLLNITSAARKSLKKSEEETQLYTYLQVKDDGLALYGFATLEEKQLFEKIITVSGAGPKTALAILSQLAPAKFQSVIVQGDRTALTKISGVGKKTAERLILELKDSFKDLVDTQWEENGTDLPIPSGGIMQDALEALMALGYTQGEAETMVNTAWESLGETYDLQELLRVALASNSRKRGETTWKRNA